MKNNYNTKNAPLENMSDEEIETIGDNKFIGEATLWSLDAYTGEEQPYAPYKPSEYKKPKWYNLFWIKIKNLFRKKTDFEKYLSKNEVNFIYELKDDDND